MARISGIPTNNGLPTWSADADLVRQARAVDKMRAIENGI
jgi:hypothetical protein